MSFGPIGAVPIASPFFLGSGEPFADRVIKLVGLPDRFTLIGQPSSFNITALPDRLTLRGLP